LAAQAFRTVIFSPLLKTLSQKPPAPREEEPLKKISQNEKNA
jgi:hypothetical protein